MPKPVKPDKESVISLVLDDATTGKTAVIESTTFNPDFKLDNLARFVFLASSESVNTIKSSGAGALLLG
jgi:hypothetical protein